MTTIQRFPMPTASGRPINYLRPEETEVMFGDLFHSLRIIRRYVGAVDSTVLDHLALALEIGATRTSNAIALAYIAAHDLHEAYVLDIPSPMKDVLPEYVSRIELPWERHVHESLGLLYPVPASIKNLVKRVDGRCIVLELDSVANLVEWSEDARFRLGGPPHDAERRALEVVRGRTDEENWKAITVAIVEGVFRQDNSHSFPKSRI